MADNMGTPLAVGWWGQALESNQRWSEHWQQIVQQLPAGSRCYYCAPENTRASATAASLPTGVELLGADSYDAVDALTSLRGVCDGAVLLLHYQAQLPEHTLERLQKALAQQTDAVAVTPLCNSHQQLSPLSEQIDPATVVNQIGLRRLDQLLFTYSQRQVFAVDAIASASSLWRIKQLPEAELRASASLDQLAHNLIATGQRLLACDHVYVHQPETEPKADLEHTSGPLAGLRVRLEQALPKSAGPVELRTVELASFSMAGLGSRAVQLHVLHDWGGGVARWVADIAVSQDDRDHLLLVAHGEPGQACGQQLRLFAGSTDSIALATWPLPQAIASTTNSHPDYRLVLEHIIARYGVTQLVISSLVGHSLDVLRTELPTQVMFHDFYPTWPLLDIALENQPPSQFAPDALQQQLESGQDTLFGDKQARHWQQLRDCYLQALQQPTVSCAAPSQSVIDGLAQLDSRFNDIAIDVVPHGLAPWPTHDYHYQHTRPSNRRLRLLVPGRISTGKGRQLLLEALPGLRQLADVYLVGAGEDGEHFFGLSGAHVVLQYERNQLPQLLQQLQPDAALLLSTVSETFSYTLSEMQSLGLPLIATAVGSFKERLSANDDWLIEPTPAALIAAVTQIHTEPQRLQTRPIHNHSLVEMAHQHSRLFPPVNAAPLRYQLTPVSTDDQRIAAHIHRIEQLQRSSNDQLERFAQTQAELEERAEWGFELKRELERRTNWAQSLQSDLDGTQAALASLRDEFDERSQWALQLDNELTVMLNSRSWQLTKPLRYATRKISALRERLGFQRQRVKTIAKRTQNSLQVRGLRGTLDRIGAEFRPQTGLSGEFIAPNVAEVTLDEALKFPSVEQPVASIIIPAFNQFSHTWTCLRSLLDATNTSSFEVIVVDDESSDETQQRLERFEGINYLRNEQNLGFIGSCNRGVEQARGDFVVLLNNDTAVGDGWLDALVDTFAQHHDAGLVGAKLVYPDGTLQEAGGIVFADGSGWNYGRNQDPANPSYNYVREVDYCSGAAIMLRRNLWQQLGGFDTRYAPAYYEDTDLAMQVRQAGLKVYFQPASIVTHFEGVSSGTDTSSGIKRYQVINQQKFVDKWRQELAASHPAPGTSIRSARDHRYPKQALIIDACTPTPDQDSGSVRMTNLMRLLRELGYQVAFLSDNRKFLDGYTDTLQQLGVEMYYQPFVPSPQQLLKDIGPDLNLVLLSRHYVASQYIDAVRWHCKQAQVVFDTVDLHYLREQRLARLENDSKLASTADNTKREELAVAERCDMTLVVSEVERAVLANDAPQLSVRVVSNIHEVFGCRRPFSQRKNIFFIGGFQHPPNIDAVDWFAKQIWPLIHRQLPDIQFHIIGSNAPKAVRQLGDLDGIVFEGFVKVIEPYLDGCRLAVAPLRYGAGVKGKVNMSMSYGQPVVATSPAVEGMFVEAGREVLVADEADNFAQHVISAYQDEQLWERLSNNGLANVERHFSFAAARRALQSILRHETSAD